MKHQTISPFQDYSNLKIAQQEIALFYTRVHLNK